MRGSWVAFLARANSRRASLGGGEVKPWDRNFFKFCSRGGFEINLFSSQLNCQFHILCVKGFLSSMAGVNPGILQDAGDIPRFEKKEGLVL